MHARADYPAGCAASSSFTDLHAALECSPCLHAYHVGCPPKRAEVVVVLQLGFFSIVGIPLFKAMAELFPDTQPILDGVQENYRHWEAATEEANLPA